MTTTNQVDSTGSNQSGGFGKYLVILVILVAAFFAFQALMPSEAVPSATDAPTAAQTPPLQINSLTPAPVTGAPVDVPAR